MMTDKLVCKGCGKETIHIADKLLSVGPHFGERTTESHCNECGEVGILNSILIPLG